MNDRCPVTPPDWPNHSPAVVTRGVCADRVRSVPEHSGSPRRTFSPWAPPRPASTFFPRVAVVRNRAQTSRRPMPGGRQRQTRGDPGTQSHGTGCSPPIQLAGLPKPLREAPAFRVWLRLSLHRCPGGREVQLMKAGSAAASGARHVIGVSLQALLIFAIVGLIVLALGPSTNRPIFLPGRHASTRRSRSIRAMPGPSPTSFRPATTSTFTAATTTRSWGM